MNMSVYILSVLCLAVLIVIAVYITYKQVRPSLPITSGQILGNIFPGETDEAGGGRQTDLE